MRGGEKVKISELLQMELEIETEKSDTGNVEVEITSTGRTSVHIVLRI